MIMYKEQDKYRVSSRAGFFYLATLTAFAVLGLKAYQLQIKTYGDYFSRSQANSIRMEEIIPSRGLIYDNKGKILVDNRPAFSLTILPEEAQDSTLLKVCRIVGINYNNAKRKLRRSNRYRPVVIKRQLSDSLVIFFEENLPFFPGVAVQSEPRRYYPKPYVLVHPLGYIGEIDEKTLARSGKYEQGDIVGKSGLEYVYDDELRGEKGVKYIRVDVKGRKVDEIIEKRIDPVPALDLHISVDSRLQKFAQDELKEERGVLVALDPRNGKIITMVSEPDYSPDIFTGVISPKVWNKLINDPGHPLTNRAVQGLYPPGSTYKMVSSVLATKEKIVSPRWSVVCNGAYQIGRKTLYCWNHKGHGKVNMEDAIKGSCNVYFYALSQKYTLDQWSIYSRYFRFGQKTGVDITGEKAGLVPTAEYYDTRLGKSRWTKGNVANLAIGQGELLVTPLQMAQFAMILANRGKYYTPHFADYFVNVLTNDTLYHRAKQKSTEIEPEYFKTTLEGMRKVVFGGTASIVALKDYAVAGKTGTAQNPHGDSHSWFICFAPYENPEIAMVVLVENKGSGSAHAAPIARRFLEMYFYGDVKMEHRLFQPKPKEDEWLKQIEIRPLEIAAP